MSNGIDPGDVAVWGCAGATAVTVVCAVVAILAATWTFVSWCFS